MRDIVNKGLLALGLGNGIFLELLVELVLPLIAEIISQGTVYDDTPHGRRRVLEFVVYLLAGGTLGYVSARYLPFHLTIANHSMRMVYLVVVPVLLAVISTAWMRWRRRRKGLEVDVAREFFNAYVLFISYALIRNDVLYSNHH